MCLNFIRKIRTVKKTCGVCNIKMYAIRFSSIKLRRFTMSTDTNKNKQTAHHIRNSNHEFDSMYIRRYIFMSFFQFDGSVPS